MYRIQGIRHKENFCQETANLVYGALFAACCIWITLSISTAMTLHNNGDFSADVLANVLLSVAATIVVCGLRYRKTVFPGI